jgi:hypothetical protein
VPKVLEGIVVKKTTFASTAPPAMEISTPPLSVRRSKRNLSSEVDYAALAGKRLKQDGQEVDSVLGALGSTPWDISLSR